MGLDMYLYAKKYMMTNWNNPEKDKEFEKEINNLIGIKGEIGKVKYITWEVMYWRKANAIHKWFVENVQEGTDDCRNAYVSKEQLKDLFETIKRVLDNHDLAEEELPTESGFFFGGTEYDEWYWKDLERTHEELDKLLKNKEIEDLDFEYHSSW